MDLAKLTGYTSKTSISKVENGKIDIPESKIRIFAKALHTTPAYLTGWTDDPNDKATQKENSSDSETNRLKIELTQLLTSLSPEEYRQAFAFIQGMIAARREPTFPDK